MTTQVTDKSAKSEARKLVGRVASARMNKTVVVVIERLEQHPVYGKFRRRSSRFFAHDESNECHRGDVVAISPCRPLSKRKSWRVAEIVERADAGPGEEETLEEGAEVREATGKETPQ